MTLPTPLEMGALAGACALGAGLALFFTKSLRLAMSLAAAAAVLTLCASVAYGYEKMGEDKIQPQLDAANARISKMDAAAKQFAIDADKAQRAATSVFKGQLASLKATNAQLNAKLAAQDAAIRNINVPAAVGQLLQPAIDAANSGTAPAPVAGAGGNAATAAGVPGDTDVASWEGWSLQVVDLYGRCVAQVTGLQRYVADITAAQPKPVQ